MAIELYEHNQRAYDAAVDMLKRTGKAVVIHPTGTGKSFIGFKLAESFGKKTLRLTPSGYIAKTQVENLKKESGAELDNIEFMTYQKLMLLTTAEMAELRPELIQAHERPPREVYRVLRQPREHG